MEKYRYVERDRLQSGISQGVLVVGAKEKSGTMNTVSNSLLRLFLIYVKLNLFNLFPDHIGHYLNFLSLRRRNTYDCTLAADLLHFRISFLISFNIWADNRITQKCQYLFSITCILTCKFPMYFIYYD